MSKHSQTLINIIKHTDTTKTQFTHTLKNTAQTHDERTVKHDKQRTVDDNGDTVRQAQQNREAHTTAKHSTVVKNQHTAEKWANAEKRTVDF